MRDIRQLVARLLEHRVIDLAASTTFWVLLAVFPFVFFAASLVALVFGPASVDAIVATVMVLSPGAVRSEIQSYAHAALGRASGADAVVALVLALWSASGGAVSLGDALNRAYDVPVDRRSLVHRRLSALATVSLCTILLFVASGFITFGPPLVDRLLRLAVIGKVAGLVWSFIRWPATLVLAAVAWALSYAVLPDAGERFRLLSPGILFGIPLWLVSSEGFTYYVAHFGNYSVAYGSLATAIVGMLWVYLSIFVLLVGGEINAMVRARGARAGASRGTKERPASPACTEEVVSKP